MQCTLLFIINIASIHLKITNKVQLLGILDKGKIFMVLNVLLFGGVFFAYSCV